MAHKTRDGAEPKLPAKLSEYPEQDRVSTFSKVPCHQMGHYALVGRPSKRAPVSLIDSLYLKLQPSLVFEARLSSSMGSAHADSTG